MTNDILTSIIKLCRESGCTEQDISNICGLLSELAELKGEAQQIKKEEIMEEYRNMIRLTNYKKVMAESESLYL